MEYGTSLLHKIRRHFWTLLLAFLFAAVSGILNPQTICCVRSLDVPNDLERLVQQLRSGEDLVDAVAAFGSDLTDGR